MSDIFKQSTKKLLLSLIVASILCGFLVIWRMSRSVDPSINATKLVTAQPPLMPELAQPPPTVLTNVEVTISLATLVHRLESDPWRIESERRIESAERLNLLQMRRYQQRFRRSLEIPSYLAVPAMGFYFEERGTISMPHPQNQ